MKMSITQALSELKLLDSKINKGIETGSCEGYMVGTKINGTLTVEESKALIKSNWQSVTDLIQRRATVYA